jgi:hypothetical protein
MTNKLGNISIEYNGNKYSGEYFISHDWITVTCDLGWKKAEIKRSPPHLLAEILLREIIQEAQNNI